VSRDSRKQHLRASRLNDTIDKGRNFYLYYPHPGCDKKTEFKRRTFVQLEQRIGVGLTTATRAWSWNSLTGAQKRKPTLETIFWERERLEL
jgi:hypothetical protein